MTHDPSTLARAPTMAVLGEDDTTRRAPRRIDRYQLEELLGEGSYGSVWKARHVYTGRTVAFKVLQPGEMSAPQAWEQLQKEARAAAAVGHPAIVQMLDCGVSDRGEPFLVMEHVGGTPLDVVLAQARVLAVPRAVEIARQVLDGLAAAHAQGIVHRDIKPGNILLASATGPDGRPVDVAKIVDFGIAKARSNAGILSTMPGTAMGTPGYMAPELYGFAHEADARVDVYAVGAMLFEMLAGRRPIEADTFEDLLRRVRFEPPPPLASVAPYVPPALAAVIDRALARERETRWQSALEFRHALEQATGLASLRPIASPGPSVPPTNRATPSQAYVTPTPTPSHAYATPTPSQPYATPAPMQPNGYPAPSYSSVHAMQFPTVATPHARAWLPWTIAGVAVVSLGLVVAYTLGMRAADDGPREESRAQIDGRQGSPSTSAGAPIVADAALATGTVPSPAPMMFGGPTEVPAGTQPPPQAATPDSVGAGMAVFARGDGVFLGDLTPVGNVNIEAAQTVGRRAVGSMGDCRRAGVSLSVRIQVHFSFGQIRIAQGDPNLPGDPQASQCVANAYRAAAPPNWNEVGTSGIFTFRADLRAR